MRYVKHFKQILKEELKHTKGVIRSRKSKNGGYYNGQKKKYKRTNNDP
jgi:hypothetical protein